MCFGRRDGKQSIILAMRAFGNACLSKTEIRPYVLAGANVSDTSRRPQREERYGYQCLAFKQEIAACSAADSPVRHEYALSMVFRYMSIGFDPALVVVDACDALFGPLRVKTSSLFVTAPLALHVHLTPLF